jgi:hypothetical protein
MPESASDGRLRELVDAATKHEAPSFQLHVLLISLGRKAQSAIKKLIQRFRPSTSSLPDRRTQSLAPARCYGIRIGRCERRGS